MAAGKTSVGRLVAERLEWPLIDLDAEVERVAGRPIPEIFRREGEEGFRELEARVTRELSLPERAVVATGGGWMARPGLRSSWEDAVRIWLHVEAADVLARLGGELDSRPMLAGEPPEAAVRDLLEERRREYARAEIRVETTGRTTEEVAEEVLRAVAGRPSDGRTEGSEGGG